MPSTDIKARFHEAYEGDIRDPILTTLLDTIEAYQEDVQDQLLLTTYAQRSDTVSDGFFEVLRRHLFGQLYPGPAVVILQASLREVATAPPVRFEQHHYFSIQDQEGEKVLFAPQHPTWIVPALTNDVKLQVYGDDIMLGFNVVAKNLRQAPDGFVSVYLGEADPLLVERLRCRLPGESRPPAPPATVLSVDYPGRYTYLNEFFHSTYENRYLRIPFEVFASLAARRSGDEVIWIPFQGLGPLAPQLEKKLLINTFVGWNIVEGGATGIPVDAFRQRMQITDHRNRETIIVTVSDRGTDPPTEYVHAATVMDPGYPFQYTTSSDIHRDEIILALSPPTTGEVKIRYYQYDVGDLCINIASGRSYALHQGIDERVKSVQSLTPTHRLNALSDKVMIWNYFRSMLASRHRWLTRDDLRAAVKTFPAFSGNSSLVKTEKIAFEEKVGRVRGFLTPFTEILVPVRDRALLAEPDRSHFERELGLYIKQKTVSGNFVRVKLLSAEEV